MFYRYPRYNPLLQFSPPDPEVSHSQAVEIAKVEYAPIYWKHSQVMEWVKTLKLGDVVVEAFLRSEVTGQVPDSIQIDEFGVRNDDVCSKRSWILYLK